jgi:hypothetical protein
MRQHAHQASVRPTKMEKHWLVTSHSHPYIEAPPRSPTKLLLALFQNSAPRDSNQPIICAVLALFEACGATSISSRLLKTEC